MTNKYISDGMSHSFYLEAVLTTPFEELKTCARK
jgi:hypothetical protein